MMLGIFVILLALCMVFGCMLLGFMWLMEWLRKREEERKDREAGFK